MGDNKQPLLTITLEDINSKPVVYVRGEKVEPLKSVDYYWDVDVMGNDVDTSIEVGYYDKEERCFKTMKFEMCDLLTEPDTTTEE